MVTRVTISVALLLLVIGIATLFVAGVTSQTAVLPMIIGGLLLLTGLGTLADHEPFYRRAMLSATVTALIGFLGAVGFLQYHRDIATPEALASKIVLAVLCGGLLLYYAILFLRVKDPAKHLP